MSLSEINSIYEGKRERLSNTQILSTVILFDTQCQTNLGNNALYLLVTVEEVVKGLTVSGKKVFAITRTVCSPTPEMFARGKLKGLAPVSKKSRREMERRREREGE